MLALSLAVSAVLGLLALWVFAPLFIALTAGAVVALMLLAVAGRATTERTERTARTLPVAGWWAVALRRRGLRGHAGAAARPARWRALPCLRHGPAGSHLRRGAGLVDGLADRRAAACAGVLVDRIGPGRPGRLALLLGGPDTAGWMAWRDQLRGYEAVPLRITLAEAPTAQREQALAELLQPLLEQGSRAVRHRQSTRFGNSVEHAVVPARWRIEGTLLEVMLAEKPPAPLLSAHVALLEQFAASGPAQAGQAPSWLMLASAQCLPPPRLRELSRLLGQGSELLARARRCTQQRSAQLQRLWPLLAGSVERVEVGEARRFHPWLGLQRWKAVAPTDNPEP